MRFQHRPDCQHFIFESCILIPYLNMVDLRQENTIRRAFVVSLILKGLLASIEIIGGLLLFFVTTGMVQLIVSLFTLGEVLEDPHDIVANFILGFAQALTISEKSFIALYLFSYGLIKLFFVIVLFKNKMWAYPASISVFGAFIVYQLYRFTHTHSPVLLLLSAFDVLVIWLIWHEYRVARAYERMVAAESASLGA
ncbi:MAG: rane protein [Parcubacteria group bacterium]|nr:rane protein [Parcubacteria group bacterium]